MAKSLTQGSCCGPTCCGGSKSEEATDVSTGVVEAVRETYAAAAKSGLSNKDAGVRAVAAAFGYSDLELASIPADANLGLSCGNPVATAHLKPGETVVDLGSGGGLDVFLAAEKVGPTGRAIGIDMTPEMIHRARRNAQSGPDGKPYANVAFHLAEIDAIPLPDASVDVVISNCVINLAPDKSKVFREIARILKPGGRLAVSDIATKQTLPPDLKRDVMGYVGCISGAISFEDYEAGLRAAGFADIQLIDSKSDLNAYSKVEGQSACCSPGTKDALAEKDVHAGLTSVLQQYDVNAYAASVKVFAVKPR
jgi:arsenite methyltransferase